MHLILIARMLGVDLRFHLGKLESEIQLPERLAQELVHDATGEQADREQTANI